MNPLTEQVFAVRAQMVDGACVDLLLFADEERAVDYVEAFRGSMPLGFDFVEVVPRRIIGPVVDRRTGRRVQRMFGESDRS